MATPQPLEEGGVAGQLVEPVAAHGAEQAHRVVVDAGPQLGVDRPEDVLRLRVPGPAQVAGQGGQAGQRLGQDRTDGESSDRSHGPDARAFLGSIQEPSQDSPGTHRTRPRVTPITDCAVVRRMTRTRAPRRTGLLAGLLALTVIGGLSQLPAAGSTAPAAGTDPDAVTHPRRPRRGPRRPRPARHRRPARRSATGGRGARRRDHRAVERPRHPGLDPARRRLPRRRARRRRRRRPGLAARARRGLRPHAPPRSTTSTLVNDQQLAGIDARAVLLRQQFGGLAGRRRRHGDRRGRRTARSPTSRRRWRAAPPPRSRPRR